MPESNLEIWSLVLAGDNAAWGKIVDRYQSLIYSVAVKCGLTLDEAGDCFQQTWIALYRNRRKIKDPDGLASWLGTTARREAFRIRANSRKYSPIEDEDKHPDDGLLPDEEIIIMERQTQLEQAIAQLGERCNRLITLLFFADQELTYEQIAAKTDISFNSLGPIRKRCIDRLRKILLDQGIESVRDLTGQYSID